jgi:hypothetical protein
MKDKEKQQNRAMDFFMGLLGETGLTVRCADGHLQRLMPRRQPIFTPGAQPSAQY